MPPNHSQLEALAAFALAFVAGVLTGASLIQFIQSQRHDPIVFRHGPEP